MRLTLAILALIAFASASHLASAQTPDPGAVVGEACATLRGQAPQAADALPVCPGEPGAAPVPGQHDHQHDPAPAPANPQDAQQLADAVSGEAQQVPQDPQGAPGHVASIVATVVQFVKDLLHLPAVGAHALGGAAHGATAALQHAAGAAGDAAHKAATATGGAFASVKAKVAGLFHHASSAPASRAPASLPTKVRSPTTGDLTHLVTSTAQRVTG